MFGFLKKTLKDSIDKITKKISTEKDIPVERIEETIVETESQERAKTDIEEKKQLMREADVQITPEIEKILEDINKEAAATKEPIEEPPAIIEEPKKEIEPEQIEAAKIEEPFKEEIKKPEEIIRQIEPVKEEPKKKGFIEKLFKKEEPKEKPAEEKASLVSKIKKAITEKKITEEEIKELLWDMQISLIESDVAVDIAEKIVNDLKQNLVGKSVKRGEIEGAVKSSLKASITEILSIEQIDFFKKTKSKKPFVIVFLGFNGAGKTTTIARVGKMLQDEGLKVLFAAADTWRAASIEQLEEHGSNLRIPVIKQKYGSDPAAVIFDAVKHAESKDFDVVLADTAGRSHANTNLIEELKKICRVNKPDMKLLVMDALTGNDIVDQSTMFNDAVGVDGMILTKVDVYEKGGALLSAVHNIKKPILFIGVGQEYDDMRVFDADEIVQNLLG